MGKKGRKRKREEEPDEGGAAEKDKQPTEKAEGVTVTSKKQRKRSRKRRESATLSDDAEKSSKDTSGDILQAADQTQRSTDATNADNVSAGRDVDSFVIPDIPIRKGFDAFRKLNIDRGFSNEEIETKWQQLSRKERKACAQLNSLFGFHDVDGSKSSTSVDTDSGAKGVELSGIKEGNGLSSTKSTQPPRTSKRAKSVSNKAGAEDDGSEENENGDDASYEHDDNGTEDLDNSGGEPESVEDESETTDAAVLFVTGVQLFQEQSKKKFTDEGKLLRSFVQLNMQRRLELWNEARRRNKETLLLRKDLTCEKGKRLRQISVVCRLEVADRTQNFWDDSVAKMTAELAQCDESDSSAVYNKYKLKHYMGGIFADLWHLDVMERLSKRSGGIRRLLQDSCFGDRKNPAYPWGFSLLEGAYPHFEQLRILNRAVLWPYLCTSALKEPPPDKTKVVIVDVDTPPNGDSDAAVSQKHDSVEILDDVQGAVEKVEHTQQQNDGDVSTGPIVRTEKDKDSAHSSKVGQQRKVEAEGETTTNRRKALQKKVDAGRTKSFAQKTLAKKRLLERHKVFKKATSTNEFGKVSSATQKKIRREKRKRLEDGSIHNNFGTFASLSRLRTVFCERLSEFALSGTQSNMFEAVEVLVPFKELSKCYDVRGTEDTPALISGSRFFYQKAEEQVQLRVVQIATSGAPNNHHELRSATRAVVPFVKWQSQPRGLVCPQKEPSCARFEHIRNIRLGCWWSVTHGMCIHADTNAGGDLVEQLRRYSIQHLYTDQEATQFVAALETLDERLTSLIDATFPHLAAQMRSVADQCRLRKGKSVFSAVTLIGARGRHSIKLSTDVGLRAIVNIPLDKKGKRKIVLSGYELPSNDDDKKQLTLNMKHGCICLIPASTTFGFTRDETLSDDATANCITLEFFCCKKLEHEFHGAHLVENVDQRVVTNYQQATLRPSVVMLDHLPSVSGVDTGNQECKVTYTDVCENVALWAVSVGETPVESEQSRPVEVKAHEDSSFDSFDSLISNVLTSLLDDVVNFCK